MGEVSYVVRITGPGVNHASKIEVEDDFDILEKLIAKMRRYFVEYETTQDRTGEP
jgi:hypothetical protein